MKPVVSIIMGSTSDMPVMKKAAEFLNSMEIPFEINALSAHRVPELVEKFATNAKANGIKVIIAGAGGAAHLPGMISSISHLPVLGVPVESKFMNGLDSLLSIIQMPYGVPTATFAVGKGGAKNAALFAVSILAVSNKAISNKLVSWRKKQTDNVKLKPS